MTFRRQRSVRTILLILSAFILVPLGFAALRARVTPAEPDGPYPQLGVAPLLIEAQDVKRAYEATVARANELKKETGADCGIDASAQECRDTLSIIASDPQLLNAVRLLTDTGVAVRVQAPSLSDEARIGRISENGAVILHAGHGTTSYREFLLRRR